MSNVDNAQNFDIEGCASSNTVVDDITATNFEQDEVTAPHGKKNKEKPEVEHKSNKNGVRANNRAKQGKIAPNYKHRQMNNMAKNGDLYEAQQAPPPSNGLKMTVESKRKEIASGETSTPTIKRRDSSSGASSSIGSNDIVGHTQVKALNETKNNKKPKPEGKHNKKEVDTNDKLKRGNVTPTYKPQQFIGLYVCKEYNGARSLGTVMTYNPRKKLLEVRFQDNRTEYMEQSEALKNMAKWEDIYPAQQQALPSSMYNCSNSSKKNVDKKKKKTTLGRGSSTQKGRK